LLGAQLAVGAAAIFARYALHGAGPLAVSALRLAIAAAVVLALVRRLRALAPRVEVALCVAGAALAVHFGAWIASLQYTSVAASTLLVATTPLWTEIADCVARRRRPSRAYVLALLLALAGMAAIASQRATAPPIPGHSLLGDGLALAGGVAIAAYFIIVRDFATDPAWGPALPTGQIVARTYSWAAIGVGIGALFGGQGAPAAADLSAWLGIGAMALVSQLLGHTALNAALRDFSPSTVAMSTLLEPVAAALLAALLFGEKVTPPIAAGGVTILVAVAIVLRTGAATNATPEY
jgi:drug/metabolite transporter (DMT)-like permease